MEAYEAARRSAEAEMIAARQARTAESASQIAEREAAKAAAAKSAERYEELKAAEPKPVPDCPPPATDEGSGVSEVAKCGDFED